MKALFLLPVIVLTSLIAHADIMKDFDSLGGNDVLVNRAKALEPDKDVKIVQNRIVDRRWRNEFSLGYNNVVGGDAYLQTQMLNLDYHLHINPHWTVGARYFSAFNQLSREGEYLLTADNLVADVDQPESGYEVVGNFAPIYGKLNVFDMGVVQFDIYGLASFGNITLKSGDTSTYSVGAGIGLWISQYISSRVEIRQRFYQAQRTSGPVDIETTSIGFSLGYLL